MDPSSGCRSPLGDKEREDSWGQQGKRGLTGGLQIVPALDSPCPSLGFLVQDMAREQAEAVT